MKDLAITTFLYVITEKHILRKSILILFLESDELSQPHQKYARGSFSRYISLEGPVRIIACLLGGSCFFNVGKGNNRYRYGNGRYGNNNTPTNSYGTQLQWIWQLRQLQNIWQQQATPATTNGYGTLQ
jgi:hypothetical protein